MWCRRRSSIGHHSVVATARGETLTPQQAFSRFYFSKGGSNEAVLIDQAALQANPHCVYQGRPVGVAKG